MLSDPAATIDEILSTVGPNGFGSLAGSALLAHATGNTAGFDDIDWFVPTRENLMASTQLFIDHGAVPIDRFARIWERWNRWGIGNFHTNSIKLETKYGTQLNIIHKTVRRQQLHTLADVLGSFDFGMLAVGYDVTHGKHRDMRSYWFPDEPVSKAKGMIDERWLDWQQGYMSQYVGLREGYRYAKYHRYGYDVTVLQPQLIQGYTAAAAYHGGKFDDENKLLADIYRRISDLIGSNGIDELLSSYSAIEFNDELDKIMEALE